MKPFDPAQVAQECFGGEMTSTTYDTISDKFMDFSFEKVVIANARQDACVFIVLLQSIILALFQYKFVQIPVLFNLDSCF